MLKFGEKFPKWWPEENVYSFDQFSRNLLSECAKIEKKCFRGTIADIIDASSNFPIEFPTNTSRIHNQPKERYAIIEEQIASAYPVIHERVLHLYMQFLQHKCKYGNTLEEKIYSGLSITDFVERLLKKRCVCFVGRYDHYLLITGDEGYSGFETIGTEEEKIPLVLRDVLSYEEIKLSALLSISSHSEFLNNGNRHNRGVIENDKSKIENAGIVIGLIGARFSRRYVMEFEDIVISKSQNTASKGYGQTTASNVTREISYRQVWNKFYEEEDFLFEEVVKDGKRFGNSKHNDDIFDNLIMKKRFTISLDVLFLESEARAAAAGKFAYIHVVGIGLGVWKVAPQQEEIFLLTCTERLKALLPQLNHVSDVHFSWFSVKECGELKDKGIFKSEAHPKGGIRTFLSNRNPADKLTSEHENTLLVVSYAWDGNALPGNEYWMGSLASSGDPSTACSTLITEIHNPHINPTVVSGENLHIASSKYGVLHIAEYSKKILNL